MSILLTACRRTCLAALSNPTYGIILLPTTIQLSAALAKLAIKLDSRPDLTRRLRKVTDADQGETGKSLAEGTAETIQRAFTVCLTERSPTKSGVGEDGKPMGKKVGIYSFANLVLKLFFQVCISSPQRSDRGLTTFNSVGKLDLLISFLQTSLNIPLRWNSIPQVSESPTFTI